MSISLECLQFGRFLEVLTKHVVFFSTPWSSSGSVWMLGNAAVDASSDSSSNWLNLILLSFTIIHTAEETHWQIICWMSICFATRFVIIFKLDKCCLLLFITCIFVHAKCRFIRHSLILRCLFIGPHVVESAVTASASP